MSNFDDLLASSRSLEENPFADPFARIRTGSPDPWCTFDQSEEDGTHNPLSESSIINTDEESWIDKQASDAESSARTADKREVAGQILQRPIETPPFVVDEALDRSIERLPTSLDTSNSEHFYPNNVSTTLRAPDLGSSPDHMSSTSKNRAERRMEQKDTSHTSTPSTPGEEHPTAFDSSSPKAGESNVLASQSSSFSSPLDRPGAASEQSFTSLSIGGESTGGWQESRLRSMESLTEEDTQSAAMERLSLNNDTKEGPAPAVEPSRVHGTTETPYLLISVDDPQKVGDAMRPYVLYTVHTKTNFPHFKKSSFSVLRRYSDFLWLYETLSMNNPGVIVPPIPEKSPFGRFDNLFIQQRRLALENCARKISNHPILARDADLRLFLESDTFSLDIKHRKNESALERGGLISTIGQTISGPKFTENDDWFERQKSYLDGLESQLRGLVKTSDSVSRQRADLALVTGEFSTAAFELSDSGTGKELSQYLLALSEIEKKARDWQHDQAEDDMTTFMGTVEEYARAISSVRMAFASRVRCYALWQGAEVEFRRTKQAHERARLQGRVPHDRNVHSLAQLASVEQKVLSCKQDFERCSRLIKGEMSRFEEERVRDFKRSMKMFVEGMIKRQQQLIAAWEGYQMQLLKRAEAIPVSGSLAVDLSSDV